MLRRAFDHFYCGEDWFLIRHTNRLRIGRWMTAVCEAVGEGPQETWGPLQPSGLYPSRHPSDVRTGWAWSACRPTPVHAGPPNFPTQEVAHQKIAATRAIRGPLLNQGSQPTWVKLFRRPKKSPQSSTRPSTRSSSAKTHQRSNPESSREETTDQ